MTSNHHWNHTSNRHDSRHRNLWTSITKAIPNCNKTLSMGQGWNRKTSNGKSNMGKSIQLVNTYHSCPQRRSKKHLVNVYCALNKVTRKCIWLMPKVEDIFSQLNGAKYFSMLDLWAGYHHIPLDKSSIPKTAFISAFGKYEYIKVPFGLAQAPAYFQELMTCILKDFNYAIAYLDDIIFSRTAEEQLNHIKQVFEKLRKAHLSMKFSKCHFFTKEIQYPGTHPQHQGHQTLSIKNSSNKQHASTENTQTSTHISWTHLIL